MSRKSIVRKLFLQQTDILCARIRQRPYVDYQEEFKQWLELLEEDKKQI